MAAPHASARLQTAIALIALGAIALHLLLGRNLWPLYTALILGGVPLIWALIRKVLRGQFGADLLAGISIVTAVILGEYLAGTLVVLMLSGGEALEDYAVGNASSALAALSKRMPSIAHRVTDGRMQDVPLGDVAIGDELIVMPHESCPVDGVVTAGHGTMDESYLTGEPYVMSKTPGVTVMSGAINGASALTIRADKLAIDSRHAKIMEVMRESEQHRPQLQRLGDQLGALYTPIAVAIAAGAWMYSGDPVRFLAVLVIATPCPLLIAIPVAVIGSVSLAARRGIIVKDPTALERVSTCRVVIFDKTGTLTYGRPQLTETVTAPTFDAATVLQLVASLEVYSKHPLAGSIREAASAQQLTTIEAAEVHERPGAGLTGLISGRAVVVTNRARLVALDPSAAAQLPPQTGGMECIITIDGHYAATLKFRDEPRSDSSTFIKHLGPRHRFTRALLVSGDRESEVKYLADKVGITEIYAGQTPEEKVALVRRETLAAPTLFLGDGINDAPALTAATVGIAFGQGSDVTAEAASIVVLDSALMKVDEILHIGARMRSVALQSAVGGMLLSVVGMGLAAAGLLTPVVGALGQEAIDVVAVLNALRVAIRPPSLTDY